MIRGGLGWGFYFVFILYLRLSTSPAHRRRIILEFGFFLSYSCMSLRVFASHFQSCLFGCSISSISFLEFIFFLSSSESRDSYMLGITRESVAQKQFLNSFKSSRVLEYWCGWKTVNIFLSGYLFLMLPV